MTLRERQRELVDHLTGRGCEDVSADDPPLVGDHDDRSARRVVGTRQVVVREILSPDLDVVTVRSARLGFGHPDVRELGIRERAPGDARGHPALAGKEHVAYRAHAFVRS